MQYTEWKPFYDDILREMGYSREKDRAAAETAAELTSPRKPSQLQKTLEDRDVAVAGAGPSLEDEVDRVEAADAVLAADAAAPRLLALDLPVDVLCTDLDSAPETAVELSEEAVPVVVHGHGDNIELLRRWLPMIEDDAVVVTSQCRPPEDVLCFGGFTDGDRAAYVAHEFDAESITLAGFDFWSADGEKLRKLRWAKKLLLELERRRDEEFVEPREPR